MSTVYVGSAAIDEHGKARGGDAGDQTGREVRTQAWYKHELGWAVIRAKDPAKREKIAYAMRAACDNPNIGYDQNQRDTLYNAAKPFGFDPGKVTVKCECDCSSLVRVCVNYAGVAVGNLRTISEIATLKATGAFDVLTDAEYTDHSDRLMTGDILCTKSTGHTVIVLNDGDKAHESGGGGGAPEYDPKKLPYLKKGSKGEYVKLAQEKLLAKGQKLPKYGADGDFWKETDKAVRAFQKANHLEVDGVIGVMTWGVLLQ